MGTFSLNISTKSSLTSTQQTLINGLGIFLLAIICMTSSLEAATLHKRSVSDSLVPVPETCLFDGPCGWEVYDPYTRNHMYYVASSCTCQSGEKCVRMTDDLGISAYVYNCRVLPARKSKSKNKAVSRGTGSAPSVTF